jgi:glycosyltransferase involved in cell wall biosynthesis
MSPKDEQKGDECEIEISVVLPCFNEAGNLPELLGVLREILSDVGSFEVIIVDDGSNDDTRSVVHKIAANDQSIQYLRLSRNFGQQAALRAGLAYARGSAVISMDADLQHPPSVIPNMVALWRAGNEIVTTSRLDPPGVSAFKKHSSRAYYRLLNRIADVRLEPGAADFRLLDRLVVDAIEKLPEADLFFRGLIPWLGFNTANVQYMANDRFNGNSKYTLGKMTSLAITGLVAHSLVPLRLAVFMALLVAGLTFAYLFYALFKYFAVGDTIPGWASVIVSVNLIGAMQLAVLGVIGEYLGRVLRETRRRPSYIVAETTLSRDFRRAVE